MNWSDCVRISVFVGLPPVSEFYSMKIFRKERNLALKFKVDSRKSFQENFS
jgi:hypothetical protein